MYLAITILPFIIGFAFIYFYFQNDIEKDIANQLKKQRKLNE